MTAYRLRLEVWHEVEVPDDLSESEGVAEAHNAALADLAFGRVSTAEAEVTDWQKA